MGIPDRSKDGSGIFLCQNRQAIETSGRSDRNGKGGMEAVYLYWRVQQDLNCLGEIIIFHEPGLIRSLRRWVRKNAAGIALAEDFSLTEPIRPSMN
jgi:hypothetical protein